jgi:hypothetical protein
MEVPIIEIQRHKVCLDPSVDVLHVSVATKKGLWRETYGSEAEVRAFVRGARAAGSMLGALIMDPGVPEKYTSALEPSKP